MRTLVIYYSLEGNTKEIARTIARELDADIDEIIPKDRIQAEKFMSYYWTGDKKTPEKKIAIEDLENDPEAYDLIFIGTPVWAWAPAPPIHSLLADQDLIEKKIALFSTSEGDTGRTFEKMRTHLSGNDIISQKNFTVLDPMELQGSKKKASAWAKTVRDKAF